MNTVDYIGKEAVGKVIRLAKLTKFIVFRQGATKGSTPVFRCTEAKTIEKAERAFCDWADSILRMNPNNNLPYDIFLYSAKSEDPDIEEEEEDLEKSKTKKDKIRFSFSLNPYNNFQNSGMGNINVAEEIKRGINDFRQEQRLETLQKELKDLREGISRGDFSNEEEDKEEESILTKVARVLKEIRMAKGLSPQVAGDDDDDDDIPDPDDDDDDDGTVAVDDDDDADEEEDTDDESADEEEAKPKKNSSGKAKRIERLKFSIAIFKKFDPEYKDLYKLACLARKQPKMFRNYMTTLRNMEI